MAYKRLSSVSKDEAERDMVFAGLAGMIDPPRAEVKDAIKCCDRAGIKSVMITGDHKLTAMAIAEELGLMKNGVALTGAELDNMSDEEFDDMVEKVEVYARVSPAHKMRIVDALGKRGHVVAMTGDGVNDAPALKKADIGIAMGITGTDVTKETADMVLTDDNFTSIVAAVEEGRGIFANIKKFLVYLLSCNIGEILLMVFAVIAGIAQPPLIAVQLLWVNLTTDGFPALALAVDPPEPDIMEQPPRLRKEGVFSKPVLRYIAVIGVWTGLVSFGVFYWAIHTGKSGLEASSLCFATMIFLELFNAFNCRSERFSLFKVGLFKNRWLIIAVTATMLVCLPLFYVPFLQTGFHTYALTLTDWAIVIGAALTIIPAAEIIKLIGRRSTASRGLAVR
jgi:Ca2+-transporting ATPase